MACRRSNTALFPDDGIVHTGIALRSKGHGIQPPKNLDYPPQKSGGDASLGTYSDGVVVDAKGSEE